MKNILNILIITIICSTITSDSKSALLTVMLKCEPDWNSKIYWDTMQWDTVRYTYFYDLNFEVGTVTSYIFDSKDGSSRTLIYDLEESDGLRQLLFISKINKRVYGILDTATLLLDTGLSTKEQCLILEDTKNIDEYVGNHTKLMQKYIKDQKAE